MSDDGATLGRPPRLLLLAAPAASGLERLLTDAEADIARRVFAGHSDREIAQARGCALRTVANQLRTIYRKLGVVSRFELVALLARAALAEERGRPRH
ncbi:MAG: helix-turn-helix transcriptional regulator [Polyangiales bacterium]|nr:helix-turn-helix transcriptional regulator [Myxococcales bacterium]MCB9661602.1 helix-turn-helix transcriptional regulator [Sandaracinaceae bacterium]